MSGPENKLLSDNIVIDDSTDTVTIYGVTYTGAALRELASRAGADALAALDDLVYTADAGGSMH